MTLASLPAVSAFSPHPQGAEAAEAAKVDPTLECADADFSAFGLMLRTFREGRAARLRAASPADPGTAEALLAAIEASYLDDWLSPASRALRDEALESVHEAVTAHPEAAAKVLRAFLRSERSFIARPGHDYRPAVRAISEAARAGLRELPLEQAGELDYELRRVGRWLAQTRAGLSLSPGPNELRDLQRRYPGTPTALRAELELITRERRVPAESQMLRVDGFVAAHPGTCAAARALVAKVQVLLPPARTPHDAVERTLAALGTVERLESPPYPDCLDHAEVDVVRLVAGSLWYGPAPYAPEDARRLLQAFRPFVGEHLGDTTASAADLHWLVLDGMGKVCEASGDSFECLDGFLAGLRSSAADPGEVDYLRAMIGVDLKRGPRRGAGPDFPQRAADRLDRLAAAGMGLYSRKALATLALMEQLHGRLPAAREHYSAYAAALPQSPFAWIAALRAGDCAAGLKDWPGAIAAYRVAAAMPAVPPPGRKRAHEGAAEALEEASRPRDALAELEAAIDASGPAGASPAERGYLEAKAARLRRSLASADGETLEQARDRVGQGEPEEAARLLDGFAEKYPVSQFKEEARRLELKARLFAALAKLDVEAQGDRDEGLAGLKRLADGPYDFAATAAKIALALIQEEAGNEAGAERAMRAALEEWRERQPLREPATELERDVASIRDAVVRPNGDGLYEGTRWNAFRWEGAERPYVVVDPEVRVRFADGRTERLTLRQRYARLDRVLFLDKEQSGLLVSVIFRLGGRKTRKPAAIMETPNQPVGGARRIISFLDRFFATRPGHWSGVELFTYPVVTEIEFLDEARTTARAAVTVGYSGGDVVVGKGFPGWWVTEVVRTWVT